MKIELGAYYLDREGRVIGPLVANTAASAYRFPFRHAHRSYQIDGSYRVYDGIPGLARRWSNRFNLVQRIRLKPGASV